MLHPHEHTQTNTHTKKKREKIIYAAPLWKEIKKQLICCAGWKTARGGCETALADDDGDLRTRGQTHSICAFYELSFSFRWCTLRIGNKRARLLPALLLLERFFFLFLFCSFFFRIIFTLTRKKNSFCASFGLPHHVLRRRWCARVRQFFKKRQQKQILKKRFASTARRALMMTARRAGVQNKRHKNNKVARYCS